jgi:hypothetical protein
MLPIGIGKLVMCLVRDVYVPHLSFVRVCILYHYMSIHILQIDL